MLWRYMDADKVYLTFDDGPVPEATPWVLDQLATYGAKGTFFCIGNNVRKYPDIYDRILAEGHTVGNHTYNHSNGWKTPTRQYIAGVAAAAAVIDSKLFRPPYGKLRPRQLKELEADYKVVMWDVLSGDYDPALTAEQCIQNVLRHTKAGSIIVFHDSVKAIDKLTAVLPVVLQHCQENNWTMAPLTFKTLQ